MSSNLADDHPVTVIIIATLAITLLMGVAIFGSVELIRWLFL